MYVGLFWLVNALSSQQKLGKISNFFVSPGVLWIGIRNHWGSGERGNVCARGQGHECMHTHSPRQNTKGSASGEAD